MATTKGLTTDEWVAIVSTVALVVAPLLFGWIGKAISNTRKQLGGFIHDLHVLQRIVTGEEGVGPGLVSRVEALEAEGTELQ